MNPCCLGRMGLQISLVWALGIKPRLNQAYQIQLGWADYLYEEHPPKLQLSTRALTRTLSPPSLYTRAEQD